MYVNVVEFTVELAKDLTNVVEETALNMYVGKTFSPIKNYGKLLIIVSSLLYFFITSFIDNL